MERSRALFFCIAGLALLGGALAATLATRRLVAQSVVADARVTKLNAGGSHPEIGYTTADGRPRSFAQGGFIFGYKVGDPARVRYRAASPETSATLDSFGSLYFGPMLLALIGGGFLIGGLVNLLVQRRG